MINSKNPESFPIDFRVGSQLVEKKINIYLIFNSPLSVDNRNHLNYLLKCLNIAGNHGMFCMQNLHPARSSLQVVSTLDLSEREIVWQLALKEISQTIFKIVIGIIQYFSVYSSAVTKLSITSESASDESLLSLDTILSEENKYLVCSTSGFNIEMEQPDRPDKNRIIQIEFVNELQEKYLDNILNSLYAWDTLCMGGFPPKGRKSIESGISPGEAYLVNAYTIEHIINLFEVSEDAFNAIINMSAFFHATYSPINKILIC